MGEEKENQSGRGRWSGQRALSTPIAAVVLNGVYLDDGALGYVAL